MWLQGGAWGRPHGAADVATAKAHTTVSSRVKGELRGRPSNRDSGAVAPRQSRKTKVWSMRWGAMKKLRAFIHSLIHSFIHRPARADSLLRARP